MLLLGLGIAGIVGTLGPGTDGGHGTVAAGFHLLDAVLLLLNHAVANPDIGAGDIAHGGAAFPALHGAGRGLLGELETQRRTQVGQGGKLFTTHDGRDNTLVLVLELLGHRKFPFHSR